MWARRVVQQHGHAMALLLAEGAASGPARGVQQRCASACRQAKRLYSNGAAGGAGGPGGMPEPILPGAGPEDASMRIKLLQFALPAAFVMGLAGWAGLLPGTSDQAPAGGGAHDDAAVLVNWSGTHECVAQRLLQPASLEELEAMVAEAHENGEKLRCVGTGLSPNGIGFQPRGMVSLALMDKILAVDEETLTVTVQAGARVQEVADALRGRGLTLQNFASIREQTVGGFTQVSAHGTGAAIPPVDETVIAMRIVTPALGTLELSKERDPHLFELARVGLGCLGVVAELTLQCVPAHKLLEHTFATNRRGVRRNHTKWLSENRHLRYMWVPHTDTVVVVTNNPLPEGQEPPVGPSHSQEEVMGAYWALARETGKFEPEELLVMSGTELRDALLALDPLSVDWVKRVNQAEAAHWAMREGYRVGWSDQLLGFDCGGQQWVLETAFPTGTRKRPSHKDLDYMDDLLKLIERERVPAHPPIEQRWSAASSSRMSPAHSPGKGADGLVSWVGIIMYLPEQEEASGEAAAAVQGASPPGAAGGAGTAVVGSLRDRITDSFRRYAAASLQQLAPKYGVAEHWAKIELPEDARQRHELIARVQARYPAGDFGRARTLLDPKNVLGNDLVDALFPHSPVEEVAGGKEAQG